ncbi:hypothetical protein SAMN05518672_1023 [Chitinophaga sp. CF118]|uniref:hypothetical protein n=1 Tax=Chitinophaga sp. CF118 TaxID=1884367 RepID=UPI0008E1F781|nr:hypothetical protein [Chitinophaga sp. CF118]SFD45119.1 hypothetical protein SAMN05518672_1023 [Chitinophaga sp. CF118]
MRKYLYLWIIVTGCLLANSNAFAGKDLTTSTIDPVSATVPVDTSMSAQIAAALFDEIDKENNYVEDITPDDLQKLPIGNKRTLSNVEYTVGITQVKMNPTYAEFTAFLRIKIPQQGTTAAKDLFFGAHGVKLSRGGGLIGDAKLALLGDFPIDLGGGKVKLILKGAFDSKNNMVNGGEPQTYASIDCSGFKELSLNADVIFSRDILLPVNANGDVDTGMVKGNFKAVAGDWNDILVKINLPDFQIKGVKDFGFSINEAVFDFSDLRNDPATKFPQGYEADYLLPGNSNVWRGVYISSLRVDLPRQLKRGSNNQRISITGKNILIDNQGFSGIVTADSLVSIGDGSAGTWPFSIDRFSLEVRANSLKGAGFGGTIKLPVDEKTSFLYDAMISPGNEYLLTVKPKDTLQFEFLRASKVTLYKNSSIELRVLDGKFLPKATLSGKMTINASLKSDAPVTDSSLGKMPGIEFKELQLQTVSPKIQVASFGYDGDISIGNFPASISNIEVAASNDQARLAFTVAVHLAGEGDGGFAAGARLELIGQIGTKNNHDNWKFQKMKLDSLGVHFDNSGIELDGHIIIFEDDPIYGKGFAGDLTLNLKKLKVKVEAKAVFGRLPTYRYWYADAFADLGVAGIPIFPGFKLNGLGGGAYSHMRLAGKSDAKTGIGVTPTGYLYKPDNTISFGFKASVGFATQSDKVLNGRATLEIAFLSTGGIAYIHFDGTAKIACVLPANFIDGVAENMDKLNFNNAESQKAYDKDREKISDAPITAVASLDIDFVNNSLHGVFEAYINAGPLKGTGPNYKAGTVVIHFDPNEWYINVGRPDNRCGIGFGLGPINLKVGSYFMVGNNLPGSPPPPDILADILGVEKEQLDYMRDLNALGSGKGIAFGANLSLSTGDLTFLMFYASFDMGLGFDIMLKDYGTDVHCKGHSGPIGMNGWYANGQAYAYLQGDVGISFKLFMKRRKISILKLGVGVLVQAKLPNPFWFTGYAGGYYSVMGGLIKGKCRFKVTLGEECEIEGSNPLGDVPVITDLTPRDQSKDIDVFGAPQAVFNIALNKTMELEDDNGNTKQYRATLDFFNISNGGANLAGDLKWSENNDAVAFYSSEILPPHTSLKATVQVRFEEQVSGSWRPVMTNGKVTTENKTITFTTGDAPESIPLSNVQYAYPVVDQQHYFSGESNSGYIRLKRGQSYLFDQATGWSQQLQVQDKTGNVQALSIAYDTANKQVMFTMPTLSKQTSYTLDIVNLPPGTQGAGQSVSNSYVQVSGADSTGGDLSIRNNQASGNMSNSSVGAKDILKYDFSTSMYTTLAQKIGAVSITKVLREPIFLPDVHALQVLMQDIELFDAVELRGSEYTDNKPLIMPTAILTGNHYFEQEINPLIYSSYPYGGLVNLPRTAEQSLIPAWSIFPIENYYNYPEADRLPFRYHLPYQFKTDMYNIQVQLAGQMIRGGVDPAWQRILTSMFPLIEGGNYDLQLQYMMPGKKGGSIGKLTLFNPIN